MKRGEISRRYQVATVVMILVLTAVMQSRIAHAISIRGAQPDLVLVVLGCGGTLLGGRFAVFMGLIAGLLTAVLSSVNYGTLLTSRTVAGAMADLLDRSMIRDSLLVPPLVVLATTAVAEGVSFLMAPDVRHLHHRITAVGGELIYNTLLAHPFYWLMRGLGVGYRKEDPFGLG